MTTSLKAQREAIKAEAAELLAKGDALTEADAARIEELHEAVESLNAKMAAADAHRKNLEGFLTPDEDERDAKAGEHESLGKGFAAALKAAGGMPDSGNFVYKADPAPAGSIVRNNTILGNHGYGRGEDRWPIVPDATVLDLFRVVSIENPGVEYLEWTFEGDPVMINDGDEKTQLTGSYVRKTVDIDEIGAYVIVSDAVLEDFPQVADKIDDQLTRRLSRAMQAQILNGDGNRPNLPGILNNANIQTATTTTKGLIDAILKATVDIQTQTGEEDGLIADAIVVHPLDWYKLRTAKDNAGQYLLGGPIAGPYGNGVVEVAPNPWGVRYVVRSTAIAEGTVLVGAFFEGGTIYVRKGVTIKASDSHGDTFVHDMSTIRGFARLGFGVDYPQAFVKITIDDEDPAGE